MDIAVLPSRKLDHEISKSDLRSKSDLLKKLIPTFGKSTLEKIYSIFRDFLKKLSLHHAP